MSDSASDPKVEDVLSSVRRLVSNDMPRVRKPDVPQHGALVLTDAQRIEHGAKTRALSQSLEERIAELEAAVSKRKDEWEPDGSEDQAQHRPDRIVYTRPPSSEEEANARMSILRLSEIALINSESDDSEENVEIGSDTPLQFRHDRDNSADAEQESGLLTSEGSPDAVEEAPMAEDVPAEEEKPAEISAFRRPEDVLDHIDARLKLGNVDAEPLKPVFSTKDTAGGITIELAPSDTDGGEETGSEDIEAAAEPPISHAESDDAPAPEENRHDDETPAADAIDDPDFEAALSNAVSESVLDDQLSLDDAEDEPQDLDVLAVAATEAALGDLLDEDQLRPLVARLIREELQGELGERITQNVRKLVRREILRALNAHEVE